MAALADLPRIEDLPIPDTVRVGRGWTAHMAEMADHIGAYDTLRILEQFGGQMVYVTIDPAKNMFREIVGAEKAAILSHVYGRSRMELPVGKQAILYAKRAGVLAAARAGKLTGGQAAHILRTRRSEIRKLMNESDEGVGVRPVSLKKRVDSRQMDMFGEDAV